MKTYRKNLQILSFLLFSLVSTSIYAAPQHSEIVNIGVLAFRGDAIAKEMWQPTAHYLTQQLPKYQFNIIPLTLDTIDDAVRNQRVHFVLTNPANYLHLELTYGVTRALTLRNRRLGESYTRFGAVIFTRSDRKDIKTIKDLTGKRFMAVHEKAFGGWWMAWRELKKQGIDPQKNFSALRFSGFPQDKIVQAVLAGQTDAGTVRTNVLEKMAEAGEIDLKDIRVLNLHNNPGFSFLLSTRLYPEWPFSILPHTSKNLAQEVVIKLLSINMDSPEAVSENITDWTIPLDYYTVLDLLKELKIGHYAKIYKVTWNGVVRNYGSWITFAAVISSLLVLFSIYAARMNLSLKKEIAERNLVELENVEQDRRISAFYDVALTSGLTFDEQLKKVLRTGCDLLDMEIGRICHIDLENNSNTVVSIVAPSDFKLYPGKRLPLDKTFCLIPYTTESSIAIHNVGHSQWQNHSCYKFTGLEAYIAAPVQVNGEKYGTINFSNRKPRSEKFTASDSNLVKLMGRWAGAAIERQIAEKSEKDKQAAEVANNAKSQFLANMSHEFRTPLNAIIGYSEMLIDDNTENEKGSTVRDLKRICRAGEYLLSLVNNILDLSKVEAGKMTLYLETIDLNELIETVVATMQPLVKNNKNVLNVDLHEAPKEIYVDAIKTQQLLLNLLSNATKFTQHGQISLTVKKISRTKSEWAVFSIGDNGIGMTDEQVTTIFDYYSQAESTTTKDFGGTGLGLAISKRFIHMMGGDIKVSSEHGKGSEFVVWLPCRIAKENTPAISKESSEHVCS